MKKKKGKLILFCGPSGAGKGTLCKYILSLFINLSFSISATTRTLRGKEINGVDYYFLSVEEFKSKIANDEFAEYEEVYKDRFYGTLKSEIERLWDLGKTVVFDVDVEGAKALKKLFGQYILTIFVKPPSVEILKQRLIERATEPIEDIESRLAKAPAEIREIDFFDYPILNLNLQHAQEKARLRVQAFLLLPEKVLEKM